MIAAPEGTTPLFIYGSLRPGQALWPWLRDSVHEGKAYQTWVRGYRLAYSYAGDYPVMIASEYRPADKLVRGTLVFVRNTTDFAAIWNMEVRAGYVVEAVEVLTGPSPLEVTPCARASAFVWPSKRGAVGDYIAPVFFSSTLAVWDWAQRPVNLLPGTEEIQSIPSRKGSRH